MSNTLSVKMVASCIKLCISKLRSIDLVDIRLFRYCYKAISCRNILWIVGLTSSASFYYHDCVPSSLFAWRLFVTRS